MSLSTRCSDSRGQGEGTKVKATKTSGGGGAPVRHTIPLGIVIFLVFKILVAYFLVYSFEKLILLEL